MIPLLFIALAQIPKPANLPGSSIALDILRPHFIPGATSLLSVAAFASGRLAVGPAYLFVELPFFNVDPSPPSAAGPTSTIGNPYVGIEFGDRRLGGHTRLSATAGVRLPLLTQDDEARTIGSYVDVSRFEAFRANTLSIQSALRFRAQNNDGFFVAASGGPTIWMPRRSSAKTDLVLHHELSVGHQGSAAWFAAGYTGLSILTETAAAVGELTFGELYLSIGGARGSVRPVLHVMLPLDEEYSAFIGSVVGFGVAIGL